MLKIDKQTVVVRNKLVETEKKLKNNGILIEKLENQSAGYLASNLVEPDEKTKDAIDEISKRLEELRRETKLMPKVVEVLQGKLRTLEEEKASLILDAKIQEQKKVGSSLVSTSKLFIESLQRTQELNKTLRDLWGDWNSQKEQTGYDELPGRTSLFSYDMLNYLNILISEYEGRETRKREWFSRVRI